MITALTALLVLVSLALVVTVPVALATPGEWKVQKISLTKLFNFGWVLLLQSLLQMVFHHQFSYSRNYSSNYNF